MASDKWAGFTDEDIQKIKNKSPSKENFEPLKYDPLSGAFKQEYRSDKDDGSDSEVIDFKKTGDNQKQTLPDRNYMTLNENQSCKPFENGTDLSDDSCASSDCSRKNGSTGENRTSSELSIHELELFEMRQKRIEAENARRRALINKAITDKKKRTQAEASKLQHITQELNRLDSILSADVSILRDYIERATKEFRDAEKTYLRVEREYVDAKLNLFDKMQKKQQLTEHLCAIIEQNENRKADKLVELMKQLEMDAIVEEYQSDGVHPILSEFCVMNEEAYQHCQVLKSPSPNTPLQRTQKENDLTHQKSDMESSISDGLASSTESEHVSQ